MSSPSYMDELRDAYYDLYDFAEEFVYSDGVPGDLDTARAQKRFYALSKELEGDGYTGREIDYLSYIAIADAITYSHLEELLREHYGHDQKS